MASVEFTEYTGRTGKRYILGRRIGGGGEGEVFRISGNDRIVAKIYKRDKKSPAELSSLAEKIDAMLAMNLHPYEGSLILVAWPTDSLKDRNG